MKNKYFLRNIGDIYLLHCEASRIAWETSLLFSFLQ